MLNITKKRVAFDIMDKVYITYSKYDYDRTMISSIANRRRASMITDSQMLSIYHSLDNYIKYEMVVNCNL